MSTIVIRFPCLSFFFFFNDTATTEIYTLSLHDALPIYLVDAGHLVFDRVLDRDDLHVGLVEAVERGIERRRLAASRGTGHEEDAVHLVERIEEALQRCAVQAERREVVRPAALVQYPHHDALAVHGGDRGDAQVDLLALDAQLDAPVLREPPFRDV